MSRDRKLSALQPQTPASAKAVASILAAGCLWGTVGVFVRYLNGLGYSPLTIVFVRMSIAFVILTVVLLAAGRRDLFRIKLKDLWCFVGTGVSSAIMLNLFFSMSTVMNPLSLAAILLATAPIFVVLISAIIFRERITAVKLQALIIAFAGAILTGGILGSAAAFSGKGFAVGLLAGFGYALYSIFTRFALNRGYDALTVNLYSFFIGSVVCAPFTSFSTVFGSIAAAPLLTAVVLLLHTLFTSLLPYVLYTYGMQYTDTGKASILVSVEPVAATVFGVVLYGEVPSAAAFAGIALVLFAIALLNLPNGMRTFLPKK
ncbi:MAG: DMT family transporter [Clostridiales Family XIII bacterium]|jgi:drug/metabolite transporter (DMT)-like permease|nr:DMT family transporter [Clostridiales Family XIII bacterium]